MQTVLIALNEYGRRVGETHHRAKLTDDAVERIRDLHEYEGKTYKELAQQFGISFSLVSKICGYERRVQRPERWKRVPLQSIAT